MKFSNEVLAQEVIEWTELLRHDPSLQSLRILLSSAGFPPEQILLAHFMEDELENEFGVVVTSEKKVFQYSRSTSTTASSEASFIIDERTSNSDLLREYPQVQIAEKLIDSGILGEFAQSEGDT